MNIFLKKNDDYDIVTEINDINNNKFKLNSNYDFMNKFFFIIHYEKNYSNIADLFDEIKFNYNNHTMIFDIDFINILANFENNKLKLLNDTENNILYLPINLDFTNEIEKSLYIKEQNVYIEIIGKKHINKINLEVDYINIKNKVLLYQYLQNHDNKIILPYYHTQTNFNNKNIALNFNKFDIITEFFWSYKNSNKYIFPLKNMLLYLDDIQIISKNNEYCRQYIQKKCYNTIFENMYNYCFTFEPRKYYTGYPSIFLKEQNKIMYLYQEFSQDISFTQKIYIIGASICNIEEYLNLPDSIIL